MSTLGHRLSSPVAYKCLFHFPKLRPSLRSLHRPFSSQTLAATEGTVESVDDGNTTLAEKVHSMPGNIDAKEWLRTDTKAGALLHTIIDAAAEGKSNATVAADLPDDPRFINLLKSIAVEKSKAHLQGEDKKKKKKERKKEKLKAQKVAWEQYKANEKPQQSPKPHKPHKPQTPRPTEPDVYSLLSKLQEELKEAETGWGPDSEFAALFFLPTLDLPPFVTGLQPPSDSPASRTASDSRSSRLDRPPVAPHLPQPQAALQYSRRIEGLLEPTTRLTLEDIPPPSKHNPIATLAHGLDRVLFNSGVHWLQDPRSKVYNFPPHIEVIPKVTDFAFERLGGFIKSSRDNDLWDLARREKRTFAGSTSSLSGMLSHIYFLISGDKDVNTDNLSRHFGKESKGFTAGQRIPASVILNHKDGIYAIDSDAEKEKMADKNILTWMGTLLEKYLTSTPEEFAPYMRFNPPPPEVENTLRDAYRYAKSEKFVMRSQLDCVDPRLPGTGVFDIKTRACLPIRMDLLNFEENSGYLIRSQTGKLESFEREYYDLIRSAFLKYSFQVRIGNMDGVIVAYHNTARMFGFQYISLQEMDEALFGPGAGIGDRVFNKCVALLEKVVEEATACFPGESVKCTFEKLEGQGVMNVWVQQAEPSVQGVEGEEGEGGVEGAQKPLQPIRQLEVKAANYLGQEPVRGSMAVGSVDEPWTTHWSVSKLASSGADIHAALEGAKQRQFRYIDIPTGWNEETVGTMWNSLNFGGLERAEGAQGPLPENFRVPTPRTKELREVARSGGEETAKRTIEEEGQAKVWLGGTVEWEELQEIQDLYRKREEAVAVVEEVTDEDITAAQAQEVEGVEEVAEGVALSPDTSEEAAEGVAVSPEASEKVAEGAQEAVEGATGAQQ
ncbi:hypothetical protein C0991_006392 [Blastosporella zonata]|nr:hypothetical protein C0991_006392 [Blastosporella zonata]